MIFGGIRNIGQNSLKKHAKSLSSAFKLQSIATSSFIWMITHLYSLDMYVDILCMQLKSSETIYGRFKVCKQSRN